MKKILAGILLGVLGFTASLWLIEGESFFLYKFWAPKEEQVRREVFEQTKSYRQGMVQELQNMLFEYAKADKEHKSALRDIILHRAADVPEDALPLELRSELDKMRNERLEGR